MRRRIIVPVLLVLITLVASLPATTAVQATGEYQTCNAGYDGLVPANNRQWVCQTPWFGRGDYWVMATWDLDIDDLSNDSYYTFVGEVGIYNGWGTWDILGQAPFSLNLTRVSYAGARPRVTFSKLFLVRNSAWGSTQLALFIWKTGGSGDTYVHSTHTSLVATRIKTY